MDEVAAEPKLARLRVRAVAALVDFCIVLIVYSLLIGGLSLVYQEKFAFPLLTRIELKNLSSEVINDGGEQATKVISNIREYDVRSRLISDCTKETISKKSGALTTTREREIECKSDYYHTGYLLYLFLILYGTYFEMEPRNATPGKKIFGIYVAGEEGAYPAPIRIIVRNILKFVFPYLFFISLFYKKNQAIHDLLGKTVVLKSAADSFSENRTGDAH